MAAGQDVFHLHFHVIPRFYDDGFESENYQILPFEARLQIANRLKAILN